MDLVAIGLCFVIACRLVSLAFPSYRPNYHAGLMASLQAARIAHESYQAHKRAQESEHAMRREEWETRRRIEQDMQ